MPEWTTLTRSTRGPKLQWIESALDAHGILHRRGGAKLSAPTPLEVETRRYVDASKITTTAICDMANDDPMFLTLGQRPVEGSGYCNDTAADPHLAAAAQIEDLLAEPRAATPWEDDLVQFARLLCEIRATQPDLDFQEIEASMDLSGEDLAELFDRAHDQWEDAKRRVLASSFNRITKNGKRKGVPQKELSKP